MGVERVDYVSEEEYQNALDMEANMNDMAEKAAHEVEMEAKVNAEFYEAQQGEEEYQEGDL